jgi:tight adherence protein B
MLDLLIRLLILLATFASVFLIAQLVLGRTWNSRVRFAAVNQRLEMIRRGASTEQVMATLRKNAPLEFENLPPFLARQLLKLQRVMFSAAVPYTLPQVLLGLALSTAILLVVFILTLRVFGIYVTAGIALLAFVLALIIGIALPIMFLSMRAQRRRRKIEDQFPVALDIFVRALRSGHPVSSAIELLTTEMEDPIGSEFGLVADEVAFGAELTDAIEAMANRWDLEDMRMFVVSLSVQIETGGNLAEILENLADVIRNRASLYRKVRSLSSEGRMTGWMLTVLPLVTFVGMFSVNPGFYLNVARDSIFLIGFPSLMLLYLIGVFWIRHLVNIKV